MSDFSPRLRTLLRESVDSFDKLEVLLWLRRQQEQLASSVQVAAALRFPELSVEKALDGLATSSLIRAVSEGGRMKYQFAPSDVVEELAAAYDERRLELMNLLSQQAIDRLRDSAAHVFADAFHLRRGKAEDDG